MNNKIAIINPFGSSLGHSALYATRICQSLSECGMDITLFTSSDYKFEDIMGDQNIDFKINKTNIKETSKNKKDLKKLISIFTYGIKVIFDTWKTLNYFNEVQKKERFSVIHIIGGETATSVIYTLVKLRNMSIKKIITIHNSDYDYTLYTNQSKIKGLYKLVCKILFSKYLLKIFDGVMVHGYQAKLDLEEQLNKSQESKKIFPINIGLSKVEIVKSSVNNDYITLLFFGIIRRDKGLDILLNALSELNSKKIKLKIIGNPSQIPFDEIINMIDSTPVKNNIEYDLRYVNEDEIPTIFEKCDYVVLPYRKTFKAQSVVLTLAAQYQKPILCSNVGQNGYDVNKYKIGKTFDAESVNALMHLLKEVENGNVNIPKECYIHYFNDNSWEMMAKNIIKMYNSENIQ